MPPDVTVCEAGAADSEKSGLEELTRNVTVALWARLLLVPVTVMVKLPEGVELAVDIVRVDDPDALIDDGPKLAVAPLGKPVALKDTVPLNPLMGVTDTI